MMRWINRHQRLWLVLAAVGATAVWFIGRGLYGNTLCPLVPVLAIEALALWGCY